MQNDPQEKREMNEILVTRPKIAEQLRQHGIHLKTIDNPYNSRFQAWLCPRTEQAERIISECYRIIKGNKANLK